MRKIWLAQALIVATASTACAAQEASVRLDLPPGYFAAKPVAAPPKASPSSAQHGCTSNCTAFDDGYAWAQAHSFKTEEQCRGRSRAFVEGCMIYVTERKRQSR